ncbi:hypothetical protein [Streptomyces sp. PAN_FS17]|uniref:hypothetical protein n=1 Tax=Streptomyces sp. PAN_FS17 TaxID=1855351 RepID=UPI0015A6D13A
MGPRRIVGLLFQPGQLRLSRRRWWELPTALVTLEWSTHQRTQSCPHLPAKLTADTADQRG